MKLPEVLGLPAFLDSCTYTGSYKHELHEQHVNDGSGDDAQKRIPPPDVQHMPDESFAAHGKCLFRRTDQSAAESRQ